MKTASFQKQFLKLMNRVALLFHLFAKLFGSLA